MNRRAGLMAGLLCLGASLPVQAQVLLAGRMGDRALLMVDGQRHIVALGQTVAGVKLLRWQGEQAVLQTEGSTLLLNVGGQPARLVDGPAPPPPAREIVIAVSPDGHFIANGAINGRAVQFMVDTGATYVALSQGEAQRLGLDLRNARQAMAQTANGPVPSQLVQLARVRVGGVELRNVDAVVLPAAMPHVLLGNSFLSRFQMRRDNDVMRLDLR